MVPRYCSSLRCADYGCDYCAECSHAMHYGSGRDRNGRHWWWEFNPYFGPTFLRKDGELMKRYPLEKHPVWDLFEDWLEAYRLQQFRHMWE